MAFEFVKNVTGILAQTQDKINRQFLKRIEALESKVAGDDTDIAALEEDVGALKTAVGGADAGLVKDVAALKTAIGSETTVGSILKRIKDLEDGS